MGRVGHEPAQPLLELVTLGERLLDASFTGDELASLITSIGADHTIVVLQSCHSGALTKASKSAPVRTGSRSSQT